MLDSTLIWTFSTSSLNLISVIIPDFHPGLPAMLRSLAKAVAS